MNKKLFYTQPTTDLLEVRVEGLVCESITLYFADPGQAGGESTYNDLGDF